MSQIDDILFAPIVGEGPSVRELFLRHMKEFFTDVITLYGYGHDCRQTVYEEFRIFVEEYEAKQRGIQI